MCSLKHLPSSKKRASELHCQLPFLRDTVLHIEIRDYLVDGDEFWNTKRLPALQTDMIEMLSTILVECHPTM